MKRLWLAAAGGALLIAHGFVSPSLPALPVAANVLLSAAIVLTLMAALVWGLLPLRSLGRRVLFVAVAGVPLWVLFSWLHLLPLANVAKIAAAAAIGLWIADELERLSWILIVAAVVAAVDIFSVAAGPTKVLLEQGPRVISHFAVAITWFGYAASESYSALGVSDVLFFAMYLGAAQRFRLRPVASAVAMVASFLVTMAVALEWTALPALPLLSLAFVAVNADLFWRRLGPGRRRL